MERRRGAAALTPHAAPQRPRCAAPHAAPGRRRARARRARRRAWRCAHMRRTPYAQPPVSAHLARHTAFQGRPRSSWRLARCCWRGGKPHPVCRSCRGQRPSPLPHLLAPPLRRSKPRAPRPPASSGSTPGGARAATRARSATTTAVETSGSPRGARAELLSPQRRATLTRAVHPRRRGVPQPLRTFWSPRTAWRRCAPAAACSTSRAAALAESPSSCTAAGACPPPWWTRGRRCCAAAAPPRSPQRRSTHSQTRGRRTALSCSTYGSRRSASRRRQPSWACTRIRRLTPSWTLRSRWGAPSRLYPVAFSRRSSPKRGARPTDGASPPGTSPEAQMHGR